MIMDEIEKQINQENNKIKNNQKNDKQITT